MINKKKFPISIHIIILLFTSFIFSVSSNITMLDDGLRHLAFASNEETMVSWGIVFPYSLFTSYDPWKNWHIFLQILLNFFNFDTLHIIINMISLFFLMFLINLYIKKYIKYNFSSLIYIIIFCIVYLTSFRYLMVRPDLLSGLYIMGALLLSNRFLPIFLLTIIYGPFYYLFFVYTGSIGLVYMVQKKWYAFIGVFFASIIVGCYFLLDDFTGYTQTVYNILIDQKLRSGLEVGEGQALFSIFSNISYFILLPIFLSVSGYLIYKYYNYFYKNSIALFLLITSILWINQHRYFSLFMPLIIIYLLDIYFNINKKRAFYNIRKYLTIIKRYFNFSKNSKLFYMIAIPYTIFMLAFTLHTKYISYQEALQEAEFFSNKIFDHKTILLNRLDTDIYKALYHNPTLHFIPSCSIGWFDNKDPNIKDIYIRMQKKGGITEEELKKLISYINADFYIHYLKNPKQVLNFEKLKKFGIIPQLIYHNRIIFKIDKQKVNKKYE